jgi:hypothetical protein
MESIISPWFIYFLSIITGIKVVFIVFTIFSGASLIFFIAGYFWGEDFAEIYENSTYEGGKEKYASYKSRAKTFLKFARKMPFIFIPLLFLSILTPDRETVITMYVADKVTWNNAQKAIEIGADIKETIKKDVIDILNILKDEENTEKDEN